MLKADRDAQADAHAQSHAIADGHYTFAPRCPGTPVRLLFAFADGTATYERTVDDGGETVTVTVHSGAFQPKALTLALTRKDLSQVSVILGEQGIEARQFGWRIEGAGLDLTFGDGVRVGAGQRLTIRAVATVHSPP